MIRRFAAILAVAVLATGAYAQTITSFPFSNPLRQDYAAPDPEQDRLIDFVEINACPTNGQILKQDSSGDWACATDETGTGGAPLSDDVPTTVDEGGADTGTGAAASRSDHDHQFGDDSAHILDSVAGIDAKLADMSIENASRTWTTLVSVADGGFVSHAGANNLSVTQAAALTYAVSKTADTADASRVYVVIRIPDTEDPRDFRVRQSFAGADYYITSWHTIGSTGSYTYAYSRHNLFAGYTIHIQKANNVTTTHFRGRIDADGTEVDPSSFDGNLGSGDTDVQTALETIDDFTLGGGGGGTDDQTAAEVTVSVTDFDGNLSASDDSVQEALDTLDDLSVGGGGGGTGTASVVAFKCALTDIVAAQYASDTQILECEATPSINEGTFVVEDASATDTTDRVVIPEDGLYELIVSLYSNNPSSGTRTTPHVSFTVETGGVVTVLDDEGTTYLRGATGSQEEGAVDHTSLVELAEDDRVGVVLRQEGATDITLVGEKSFLAIVKAGGAVGPAGADGTGGGAAVDGVDVQYITNARAVFVSVQQDDGNDF